MHASLTLHRRALPALALAALGAKARADTLDLALTCDTTLAPALRRAAAAYRARSGVRVFVFPTSPGLILPQLVRDIQNDIVVTDTHRLAQAAQAGVIAAPTPAQWRDRLVIAGPRGNAALDRVFALCDPLAASDIDGPGVLARLGVTPARTLGAAYTGEVAYLLGTGAAQAGLLRLTDVRADPRLAVLREVPNDVAPPSLYAASVTRLARRPNPQGFVAFLATPDCAAILAAAGLEPAA